MSLVSDHDVMDKELLVKYKQVAKSKIQKFFITTKLVIGNILFYLECWSIAIRSILYYFFVGTKSNRIIKDIKYSAKRPRNVCDVYLPKKSETSVTTKIRPCLVFVHGGSWGYGDKIQYILLGKQLSDRGIIVVVCNYTLYPKGTVTEMVDDVEQLLVHVKNHVHEYGGTPDNIHLAGHSAGAHITALYVCTRLIEHPSSTAVPSAPSIRSFIGMGGVYDISDHFIHESKRGLEHVSPMRPACKGPSKFKQYSPCHLLELHEEKSLTLPCNIFLLHGELDKTVPISSAEKFEYIISTRFKSNNTRKDSPYRYIFNRYPNVGHIDLVFGIYDDNAPINVDGIDYNTSTSPDMKSTKKSVLQDIIRLIDRRT
ncbi:hypothetical protein DFA_01154 [Cavenderia fasciculata]|uniref:BD-FAE-like domain-containing protein n=1 Tax=Cavenderia fasciculata TaxID=261658 RepID=F4PR74_CACFS|nr:uncharacterized protein DFA_01154 [Cavenderia fasciculata]EGG21274.1 hypothetical protein DFA_01154 [Cavenderia fasciculata]|eukprot:XP_004359124.1 hypothetical protein DFA_01154 [Cavenderia fasciculata]